MTTFTILRALGRRDLHRLATASKLEVVENDENLRRSLLEKYHGDLTGLACILKTAGVQLSADAPASASESGFPASMLYSTRIVGTDVVKLRRAVIEELLFDASALDLASAFYDPSFLESLFENAKSSSLKRIRLVFNGLAGSRLRQQLDELTRIQTQMKTTIPDTEIRLKFEPGMFHTKLYLFHGQNDVALVGSANATGAAFSRNEEILVSVPIGDRAVFKYFDRVWDGAVPLDQLHGDVRATTLIQFFRTGTLYFKPLNIIQFSYHPFRDVLRELNADELDRLSGKNIPHAEQESGIGPFSLRLAVDFRESLDDELQRVPVKTFSVETCLGYWVPDAFRGLFEAKIEAAAGLRRRRLSAFLKTLRAARLKTLSLAFSEYRRTVIGLMKDAGIDTHNWAVTQEPEPAASRKAFDKFVDRLIAKLEDPDQLDRACRGYIDTPMPEIWDDPVASEDFTESFFDYIEFANSGEREHRIIQRLRTKCRFESHATSKEIQHAVGACLKHHGWSPSDWGEDEKHELQRRTVREDPAN